MKTKNFTRLFIFTFLLFQSPLFAYDVWMGLHCIPQSATTNIDSWKQTSNLVTGLNANLAPCDPSPGTVNESDIACTTADWKKVVTEFSNKSSIVEIARSNFKSVYKPEKPILQELLTQKFNEASTVGYNITVIMIYNNKVGDDNYNWLDAEATAVRTWLDNNNHSGVKMMWDGRNNSTETHYWFQKDIIDLLMIESGPELWEANNGDVTGLVNWIKNPANGISNKRIFLQIPCQIDPYGISGPTSYIHVRQLIRNLGIKFGLNFLKSNVVLMPVTYNSNPTTPYSATYRFWPETKENGTLYVNSLTGLTLSLIEQKSTFENGATTAQCNSYTRTTANRVMVKKLDSVETASILINCNKGFINVNLGSKLSTIEIFNSFSRRVYSISNVKDDISIPTNKIGGKGVYIIKINNVAKKIMIAE